MDGWGGWFQNRPQTPQITQKIVLLNPNFTFHYPKSHKNPGVGKQIWENFPKKMAFILVGSPNGE